jgi:hypothetical protein
LRLLSSEPLGRERLVPFGYRLFSDVGEPARECGVARTALCASGEVRILRRSADCSSPAPYIGKRVVVQMRATTQSAKD